MIFTIKNGAGKEHTITLRKPDVVDNTGNHINIDKYYKQVAGCWMGKNIGGTFGAPFEGQHDMNDAKFYTNLVPGIPAPNDDLDIQLVWLQAAAERGLRNLTPHMLGEYWFAHVVGPWNEYGVCRGNIQRGFMPPLSGAINNETWYRSNGAWIRSEIWACLCPGCPDEAIRYAYMDACCDHAGDGIYAELFTAALESAAFIINDLREIVRIGLSKIPADCRVRRAVDLAFKLYDNGTPFAEARNAIVKDSEDLGMFQAPANVAFCALGLLYGEGDFEKSLQYAVNCGDDTDCTGATVGAIFGIMNGIDAIPAKWKDPIGTAINTTAINNVRLMCPSNTNELTDRVVRIARDSQLDNPLHLIALTHEETFIKDTYRMDLQDVAKRIWDFSPYELQFPQSWGDIYVDYVNGPEVEAGVPKELVVKFAHANFVIAGIRIQWNLPEGCHMSPASCQNVALRKADESMVYASITFDETDFETCYIPVDIYVDGRNNPFTINVPFQCKGAVDYDHTEKYTYEFKESLARLKTKYKAEI